MEKLILTAFASVLGLVGGAWFFWLIGWAFNSEGFVRLGWAVGGIVGLCLAFHAITDTE